MSPYLPFWILGAPLIFAVIDVMMTPKAPRGTTTSGTSRRP